ncbi:MAG: hypothetical protein RIS70_1940 [Planctomycetota bacterium]|jgi:hypothetical protein
MPEPDSLKQRTTVRTSIDSPLRTSELSSDKALLVINDASQSLVALDHILSHGYARNAGHAFAVHSPL